jgi:hypothetical protein
MGRVRANRALVRHCLLLGVHSVREVVQQSTSHQTVVSRKLGRSHSLCPLSKLGQLQWGRQVSSRRELEVLAPNLPRSNVTSDGDGAGRGDAGHGRCGVDSTSKVEILKIYKTP